MTQPEPDTKDWTWVLRSRCEECGLEASSIGGAEIPGLVRSSAERWAEVLARPGVGTRPAPGVWSPLEYGCHVRDVCRVMLERAQAMLTGSAPTFSSWNQDEAAVAGRYGQQQAGRVAAELEVAAAELARCYAGVADDQWQRVGHRGDGAEFTVLALGQYLAHELVHHLHDVRG